MDRYGLGNGRPPEPTAHGTHSGATVLRASVCSPEVSNAQLPTPSEQTEAANATANGVDNWWQTTFGSSRLANLLMAAKPFVQQCRVAQEFCDVGQSPIWLFRYGNAVLLQEFIADFFAC